jgi:hypothetical protein
LTVVVFCASKNSNKALILLWRGGRKIIAVRFATFVANRSETLIFLAKAFDNHKLPPKYPSKAFDSYKLPQKYPSKAFESSKQPKRTCQKLLKASSSP